MKISDYIVPLILAYLTVWGVQYYFGWGYTEQKECPEKTEQHFIAPTEQVAHKPLKKEIDFFDAHKSVRSELTTITTKWGQVEFSSRGASIESIDFLHGDACPIRTIFPSVSDNTSERALLVALDQQTPLAYELIAKEEGDKYTSLSYRSRIPQVTIVKSFVVDHIVHKIDMTVEITPLKGETLEFVRVVWPSPILSETVVYNVTSGLAINNVDTFEKTALSSLNMQQGWYEPQLFGTDNKYFVHALLNYSDNAVARAYYKTGDDNQLQSIIELPVITEESSFEYSFYFGPKELDAITAVDGRLEQTLDFSGILSPISKLFLKLLNWLNDYLNNLVLAIIALTILMRLVMMPFTLYGEKAIRKQQAMSGKMNYLKQKYKNDPERLQQEQAKLITQEGISGLGGCLLPMITQGVMFFALRTVLNSSLEMYQTPFLWIPDLSASDPYYILPALVFLGMIAQFMQNSDKKARNSSLPIAIVIGFFSAMMSSGLVIYLIISTFVGVFQSRLVKAFSK